MCIEATRYLNSAYRATRCWPVLTPLKEDKKQKKSRRRWEQIVKRDTHDNSINDARDPFGEKRIYFWASRNLKRIPNRHNTWMKNKWKRRSPCATQIFLRAKRSQIMRKVTGYARKSWLDGANENNRWVIKIAPNDRWNIVKKKKKKVRERKEEKKIVSCERTAMESPAVASITIEQFH